MLNPRVSSTILHQVCPKCSGQVVRGVPRFVALVLAVVALAIVAALTLAVAVVALWPRFAPLWLRSFLAP